MAKKLPSTKEMKKAVEEFKKQFTTGFYHGSPSPNIKEFDPSKTIKDPDMATPGVTFVSPKPRFAESYLADPAKERIASGATMYPVSVNMGKHFDPATQEGSDLMKQYLMNKYKKEANTYGFDEALGQKHEYMMDRLTDPINNWKLLESPELINYLKSTGHDTFSVTEGGVKNVGIFDPKNIRGKFAKYNPEDADSPDFMKAEGGAIKHYDLGGKVKAAKKALEHARSVPFVHFSNKPNLMQLDPNMYGTGIKGQEAARLKSAPDIRPRSYIYTDRPDVRPEQGLGSHKYSGVAEDMYPLHEDPAGYSAIAKTKAIDPYMMSMGREVIDQPTHLNELERLIKAAGYKGYANDDVGLLFHPTEVKKISGPEHFADGGSVQHFLFGGSVDAVGPTIGPAQVPGVAGTLATTETPVGLLPSNLNDFVTGGGKFNPTTGLPSNYQEARTAFDQQQQAERAKNPFGNVSATVVGNDQFGQQFGYASDADAFNQFYNKNYGASAPVIAPEYKTGSAPVTTATGDSTFSNTNLGGLSGALAGNNPVTPTAPAIINSTTSQLPSNWQQTYTGPSATMVGWQPNIQQYAANNTAGFTLPTKPVNAPMSTTGGGLSSLIPTKPTVNPPVVKPQLPPSSPVAAATLPPPKVDFRNAMKPVAMAVNQVRQNPIVKPMFSRTNFFKKR